MNTGFQIYTSLLPTEVKRHKKVGEVGFEPTSFSDQHKQESEALHTKLQFAHPYV